MRTTAEIVSDAKDGIMPSHEECFWAMLALSGKLHFAQKDLEAIGKEMEENRGKPRPMGILLRCPSKSEVFSSHHKFLNKDPKEWLGKSGDPFSAENQEIRKIGKKLINKAAGKNLF